MSEKPILTLPTVPFQDQVTVIAQPTNPIQLHVQAVRVLFIDSDGQPLEQPKAVPIDEIAAMQILLDYVKLRLGTLAKERKSSIIIAN
jgi:hypothetical protein